jgi:hypothetical protein
MKDFISDYVKDVSFLFKNWKKLVLHRCFQCGFYFERGRSESVVVRIKVKRWQYMFF